MQNAVFLPEHGVLQQESRYRSVLSSVKNNDPIEIRVIVLVAIEQDTVQPGLERQIECLEMNFVPRACVAGVLENRINLDAVDLELPGPARL